MIQDIFSFDDFLSSGKRKSLPLDSVRESIEEDDVEPIVAPSEEDGVTDDRTEDRQADLHLVANQKKQVLDQEEGDFYNLYSDKSEEFVCDIMVEGSSPEETWARIIVESENWSLVFPGEIRNGKCYVPIKKLNILKEGEIGKIKLEVIAEGNLFIPWENKFRVKLHKKVTVMNENKINQKPIKENKIGVKVNFK